MAVVVNTNLGGRKTIDIQGLKIVQCELTVQAADFPTTGLPLNAALLAKLGLKSVVAVISANKRTTGGVTTGTLLTYDYVNKTLNNTTTLSNTTVGTATAAVNDDVVALTILGY